MDPDAVVLVDTELGGEYVPVLDESSVLEVEEIVTESDSDVAVVESVAVVETVEEPVAVLEIAGGSSLESIVTDE